MKRKMQLKCSFLILLLMILNIQQQRLVHISYEFPYGMTSADVSSDWQINGVSNTNFFTSCLLGTSFGPLTQNTVATRTYDLSAVPHYFLYFGFEIDVSGSWDNEYVIVQENGNTIRTGITYHRNGGYMDNLQHCVPGGSDDYGVIDRYAFGYNHNSANSLVSLSSNLDEGSNDESYGVNHFFMSVVSCHDSCASCGNSESYDMCTSCPANSNFYDVDGDGFGVCLCDFESDLFAEGWNCVSVCPSGKIKNYVTRTCDIECDINCATCSGDKCSVCNGGYFLLNGKCVTDCPFYTTVSGTTCVDADFNAQTNGYMLLENWSDKRFTHSDIMYDGWTYDSDYQSGSYTQTSLFNYDCNGESIVFGQSSYDIKDTFGCNVTGCYLTKIFNDLPPHYRYHLKYRVLKMDNTNGGNSEIHLDGTKIDSIQFSPLDGSGNICGHPSYRDKWLEIDWGDAAHTSSTLEFQLNPFYIGHSSKMNDGYREVQIYLYGCDPNCASCAGDASCDTCIASRINPPNCADVDTGYWDDGTLEGEFPACEIQCATCGSSGSDCLSCSDPSTSISNGCKEYDTCFKYIDVTAYGLNEGSRVEFFIDGVDQASTLTSGIEVTLIDSNFNEYQNFQLDTGAAQTDVDAFINLINGLPDNAIVVVALTGIGMEGLNPYVYEALGTLGYDKTQEIDYGDALALIGNKNVSGDWRLQKSGETNPRAHVEKCIVDCDSSCKTCAGGKNLNDCQSCNAPDFLQYNPYTDINECVTTCFDGNYGDSGTRSCVNCPAKCYTCSDSSTCIKCASGYYYDTISGDCEVTCPNGYYPEEDGRACQLCDSGCDTCSGPSSSECILCKSTPSQYYRYSDNQCYDTCPDGSYADTTTLNCESCQAGCVICTDGTSCSECESGYYLYGGSCGLTCPAGHYENPDPYNTCETCNTDCSSCAFADPDQCTACYAGYFLYNNFCYQCEDLDGFYTDPNDPSNCLEICGDGLVVSTQFECDDGNTDSGDGCSSKCKIENGYYCEGGNEYQQSICKKYSSLINYKISSTDSSSTFYNLKQNYDYYFTITFDQEFFLTDGDSILEYLVIELDNQVINFPVTLYYNSQNNLEYVVGIEFDKTYRNRKLNVYFNDTSVFTDSQGNSIVEQNTELEIQDYFHYTEEQREYTITWVYYIHLGLTFIFIYMFIYVFCNKFYRVALALDNMQFIYMLGFLNFRQCINGYMFFDEMQGVMTFWIHKNFDIDGEEVDTSNQYKWRSIQSQVIDNITPLILVLLVFMITHLIFRLIMIVINKNLIEKEDVNNKNKYFYKFQQLMKYIVYEIIEIRLMYDVLTAVYSVFLFYVFVNFYYIRWSASSIVTIVMSLFIMVVPPIIFKLIHYFKNDLYTEKDNYGQSIDKKKQQTSFFFRNLWQFLKTEQNYVKYFNGVFMLRKLFHVAIIVGLQNSISTQMFMLLPINILYVLYIYFKKPFIVKSDNTRIVLAEIFIIIGIILSYNLRVDESEDEISRFDKNQTLINIYTACMCIHIAFFFWDTWYHIYYYTSKFCLGNKAYTLKNVREQRKQIGIEPMNTMYTTFQKSARQTQLNTQNNSQFNLDATVDSSARKPTRQQTRKQTRQNMRKQTLLNRTNSKQPTNLHQTTNSSVFAPRQSNSASPRKNTVISRNRKQQKSRFQTFVQRKDSGNGFDNSSNNSRNYYPSQKNLNNQMNQNYINRNDEDNQINDTGINTNHFTQTNFNENNNNKNENISQFLNTNNFNENINNNNRNSNQVLNTNNFTQNNFNENINNNRNQIENESQFLNTNNFTQSNLLKLNSNNFTLSNMGENDNNAFGNYLPTHTRQSSQGSNYISSTQNFTIQ